MAARRLAKYSLRSNVVTIRSQHPRVSCFNLSLTRRVLQSQRKLFVLTFQERDRAIAWTGVISEFAAEWSPTGKTVVSSSKPVRRNPEQEPPAKAGARVEGPALATGWAGFGLTLGDRFALSRRGW